MLNKLNNSPDNTPLKSATRPLSIRGLTKTKLLKNYQLLLSTTISQVNLHLKFTILKRINMKSGVLNTKQVGSELKTAKLLLKMNMTN